MALAIYQPGASNFQVFDFYEKKIGNASLSPRTAGDMKTDLLRPFFSKRKLLF